MSLDIDQDFSTMVYHYERPDKLCRATLEYENVLRIRAIVQFIDGEAFIIQGTLFIFLFKKYICF